MPRKKITTTKKTVKKELTGFPKLACNFKKGGPLCKASYVGVLVLIIAFFWKMLTMMNWFVFLTQYITHVSNLDFIVSLYGYGYQFIIIRSIRLLMYFVVVV